MKFKFLATAVAVVASVSAAGAADLNKPAKVAIDYVKICSAYGAGFFYIPGSDTCLKISGYIYTAFEAGASNTVIGTGTTYLGATGAGATYGVGTSGKVYAGNLVGGQRGSNSIDSYVRADVNLDARTNTEYGLLRSFTDFHVDYASSAANAAATSIRLDAAYIQFAGVTAGRANSFYSFLSPNVFRQFDGLVAPFGPVDMIGYTYAFGNGVSGSIAMEDPTTAGYANSSVAPPNTNYSGRRPGATFTYGGLQSPDITANLNVTQSWGAAQISGGLHQDYGSTAAIGSKWGYGFLAGVRFLAPMLGTGDFVQVQGAYSLGNIGFADWANAYALYEKGTGGTTAQYTDLGADATWSAATGIKQTKAWSVYGTLTHYFSPNLEFDGSVGYLYEDGYSQNLAALGYGNSTFGDVEAEFQLQWKPITQVQISPYVELRSVSFTSGTQTGYGLASKTGAMANFGLRFRRDF